MKTLSKYSSQDRTRIIDQFCAGNKSQSVQRSMESYKFYEKTVGIIDRMNIALGRKEVFSASTNSTLIGNVDLHGIISTKKI